MFHIFISNHLENLAAHLATLIRTQPLPPMTKEVLMVQSRGMERWLAISLAHHLGVWANGDFSFPDDMLWRIWRAVFDHIPDTSPFKREVMVWSLLELIPHCIEQPHFSQLRHYLESGQAGAFNNNPVALVQLAMRIADTFDQYVVYRPDMILEWDKDEAPEEWQAILWRALRQRCQHPHHRATLRQAFLEKLHNNAVNPAVWQRLPKRISLFGISALPPFYLDALDAIAEKIEVYIFLLSPCQKYWGDILSDREIARHVTRTTLSPEDLHLEKGNSLLASLGRLGREFIHLLLERHDTLNELFVDIEEHTLLTCIQADILHLRERGEEFPPTTIQSDDKSVQIHACYSAMREVEVLHDQLLALFDQRTDLLPKDIVVMTPDIESYAPFIQAIFGATLEPEKRIPFSITDRSLRGESGIIDTFLAILELRHSRFTTSEILTIIENPTVQQRFDLSEQDLVSIRLWIEETGIRWAREAKHRQSLGLPATTQNTWQLGLQRLLLGVALSPQRGVQTLYKDILPFDAIEGTEVIVLGKFVALIEQLMTIAQALEQPRSPSEWVTLLHHILDRFFVTDEDTEGQLQQIREEINTLESNSQRAGFTARIDSAVIITQLQHTLAKTPQTVHFITGNVTFCTLLPMRSIPYRVVCLLGMNDQTYPRPNSTVSFDLIAKEPCLGDRSRLQNDRYLFLEALLSARECFYISYIGHSVRDNTVLPPSVLVSELQETIEKGFTHPTQPILAHILYHHPLQAFNPRYFNQQEPQLFSYANEYCLASQTLSEQRQTATPFLTTALPEPPLEWRIIELQHLIQFFTHPVRFFLRNCLGIQLPSDIPWTEETEPFTIAKGLDEYHITQDLVEKGLAGYDLSDYRALIQATGKLPHGNVGDYFYTRLSSEVHPFIQTVKQASATPLPPPPIHVTLGDLQLTGYLENLTTQGLVHYRYTSLKAKDHIALWIKHLILNSLTDQLFCTQSTLIGKGQTWQYTPLPNARTILTQIVEWYWQGLQKPLFFFPDTSLAFAEQYQEAGGNQSESALKAALKRWESNDYGKNTGEGTDEYYQICFDYEIKNGKLFDEAFQRLALDFFTPLLEHRIPN